MRLVLTIIFAAITVEFAFMLPAYFAPYSEVGIVGVVFKGIVLMTGWVFVYRLWKIDFQPKGSAS